MMKDKYQKQKLLQYFLSRGWYPQLEVDIYNVESIDTKLKMITDIDVLAMSPMQNGILKPVIGDCKTLKNQSPINRVFWIKGLMSYINSDYGIILLSKNIEGEHKILANSMNVSLLSDEDFKVFSKATMKEKIVNAALIDMNCWDKYFDIPNKSPNLYPLFWFCKSGFWNEREIGDKLRHCVGKLQNMKPELNPGNNYCMFLFLELCSIFAISLNEITIKIFNKYLWPHDKCVLDHELKILLWGGYENYKFWNNVRDKLYAKQSAEPSGQLSLPEWSAFVQLIRSCMESPMDTSITPIIIKELAFQSLIDQQSINNSICFLEKLVKENPMAARDAIMTINYLSKAAKLPPEFTEYSDEILMKLQRS